MPELQALGPELPEPLVPELQALGPGLPASAGLALPVLFPGRAQVLIRQVPLLGLWELPERKHRLPLIRDLRVQGRHPLFVRGLPV